MRARQLVGRGLPDLVLGYAPEGEIELGVMARRFPLVICLFPAIGTSLAAAEDQQRAEVWQRYDLLLVRTGYRLLAVSSDDPAGQHDWLEREAPTYLVLCDQALLLACELGLPTALREGKRVYAPATLIVRCGRVQRLFHPVGPDDARVVIRSLTQGV